MPVAPARLCRLGLNPWMFGALPINLGQTRKTITQNWAIDGGPVQ